LGPSTRRSGEAAAAATSSRSNRAPAVPVSRKPAEITTTPATPAVPHSRTSAGTVAAGVQMIATSGACASSETEFAASMPCTARCRSLTGCTSPANEPSVRLAITTPPTLAGSGPAPTTATRSGANSRERLRTLTAIALWPARQAVASVVVHGSRPWAQRMRSLLRVARITAMGEHLTALDATFLELEEADDSAHMHIGAVLRFGAAAGGPPSIEAIRRHLALRLDALPGFALRLSERHTGGLHWPEWVDAAPVDMTAHVRHATVPAPGGERELREWAADFWSHRLDRSRPLWEIALVDGLEDGGWALVTKTHHCLVDGVGSVDVGHLVLDASPDAGEATRSGEHAPAPRDDAEESEGRSHRLVHLPLDLAAATGRTALGVARTGAGMVAEPSRAVHALERSRALVELLVRDEFHAAPESTLNRQIGAARRFEVVHFPLDDLKAIKQALGGTVNDVVLAATTGGLRELMLWRDEPPPAGGLRAMVPMNVRDAGEHLSVGNRVSSLFVSLPVDEPDPLAAYLRVHDDSAARKTGRDPLGAQALTDLTGMAPPVVHSFLARSLFATRLFNVTVTNVPGPQSTLYAFGAPLRDVWPLVPLAADHAIGVAVVSYAGRVTFGLIGDHATALDLDVLGDGIERSLERLRELAQRRTPRLPSQVR
jgi:WS/DGAT/MGAT family acyltransferase